MEETEFFKIKLIQRIDELINAIIAACDKATDFSSLDTFQRHVKDILFEIFAQKINPPLENLDLICSQILFIANNESFKAANGFYIYYYSKEKEKKDSYNLLKNTPKP